MGVSEVAHRLTVLRPRVRRVVARAGEALRARRKQIVGHLVVGVVIAVALAIVERTPDFALLRDWELDVTMRLFADTQPVEIEGYDHAHSATLLDIDDATIRRWDAPLFTPRDKLEALIRYAAEGGASLIVLDVLLNHQGSAAGAKLGDYLARYARTCAAADGGPLPPLILERGFIPGADPASYEMRPSFVDGKVKADSACVFWASPLFDVDARDGVIRRWRQWESYRTADGRSRAVPSTQLAVASILGSERPGAAFDDLRESLTHGDDAPPPDRDPVRSQIRELVRSSREGGLGSRIFFTIPWHRNETAEAVSAYRITDPQNGAAPPSFDPVRDRLVLIGSTAANADLHATPLGMMPGSLVILNAVQSLRRNGVIHELPWWYVALVEAVLILVMTAVFLTLRSPWAMTAGAALLVAAIPFTTFRLLHAGIWLDFMIPLGAIALHGIVQRNEELHAARQPAEGEHAA